MKWRFLDEENERRRRVDVPAHHFQRRAILRPARLWPKTERVSRFRFRSRRNSARSISMSEFGPLVSTVGRSELIYGIVGGTEVSKTTSIMAELHGTSRTNFTRDVVTLNFGWRHKLNEHAHLDRLVRPRAARAGTMSRSRSSATAACSCFTERSTILMRFGSRLLRENQDQGDDHHQERQRGGVTAESQPSFRDRLIEKIADDGAERASQDECRPKQNDV